MTNDPPASDGSTSERSASGAPPAGGSSVSGNGDAAGDGGDGGEAPSLRDLVVRAGLEVLDRDGLSLGAQSLSYAKVFAYLEEEHGIKIARASVHERIWANHAEFRREVVAEAIAHLPADVLGSRAEELRAGVLDMYARGLDTDERVAELCRRFAPMAYRALDERPSFRDVQVAKALASSINDPGSVGTLQGPIRDRVDAILADLSSRLAVIVAGLGLQPRRSLGLDGATASEALAVMFVNLFIGAFLDVNAGADEVARPLAIRGRPATGDDPWTMLGLGWQAALNLLFEADDGTAATAIPVPPSPPPAAGPEIDGRSPRRRRRHELRELVLSAGVQVLLRERLDLRPESLSYASVFEHIKERHDVTVHRASVHNRIWSSHDDYWLDVLTAGIYSNPNVSRPAVDQLLAYTPATRPDGSLHARQVAQDVLRIALAAETARRVESPHFQRRQSIKAALLAEPPSTLISSLRQAIHDTQLDRVARHSRTVRERLVPVGFEPRPELGIDVDEAVRIVITLVLTSAGGYVFDRSAGVDAVTATYRIRREDDPDRTDEWTAPGLAAWAYFDLMFQEIGGRPQT